MTLTLQCFSFLFVQAEVLRCGGAEVQISYLELFDNNIGPIGGLALGQSLAYGGNLSLLTLKLDYNSTLGTKGVVNLCKGLRSNSTLKQLHLQFCQLEGEESGNALSDVLSSRHSNLEVLNVGGNRLGGLGLFALARGLMTNTKLTHLSLADNMIDGVSVVLVSRSILCWLLPYKRMYVSSMYLYINMYLFIQTEEDLEGLNAFSEVLVQNEGSALSHIDLMYNRIGEAGATILAPGRSGNKKIQEFLVDFTLPRAMFDQLFLKDEGGKKKKKGKKGKKK